MPAAPVEELPVRDTVLHAMGWQVVAFLGLACHVLLVREGSVALAGLGVAFLGVLYAWRPLAGLAVFLSVLLYQNWFIAFFSAGMDNTTFRSLQGTTFLLSVVLAAIAAARILWLEPARTDRRVTVLARLVCLALLVTLAYAALGAARSSAMSAAVYFRVTVSMLLALLVGLDVGRVFGYRTVATGFLVALVCGLLLTLVEVMAPHVYYSSTGAVSYMNLKYGPANADWPLLSPDDLVRARTQVLFNITGSASTATSFRFAGPNQHAISYAYVLAVAGIVAVALRQSWLLLIVLPLLVLAGVKGALILLVASLALYVPWRLAGNRRLLLTAGATLTVAYVGLGLTHGLQQGDFHVIGFLGGLRGFLRNPLGHGIGAGGNLSTELKGEALDWQELQRLGVDFALESAVGVLLYQLGIGALALFCVFFAVLRAARPAGGAAWRLPAGPRPTDIAFIALAMVVVNGIFQEEAYSPYALGLLMLFCGVLIGNGDRPRILHGTLPLLQPGARPLAGTQGDIP
ncbi:hypothetical protein [Roseicella aerolata]|uniref:O-antigen ligase n=1 Tax=Roseicella aerolata TaxID=2883479 RepID=A0A9X1ICE5_9PROT|nr:hypothetical protein [Roseicella aerolata]MCB4821354.1 hypothetical protein [Roseicella aerolata]